MGVMTGITGDGLIDHMTLMPGEGPIGQKNCPVMATVTEGIGIRALRGRLCRVFIHQHPFIVRAMGIVAVRT
jgi:hypothetical protein